jgi:hypothetical protein
VKIILLLGSAMVLGCGVRAPVATEPASSTPGIWDCGFDAYQITQIGGDEVGSKHRVACPAGCYDRLLIQTASPRFLRGTDVYAANSPTCKAALHAGLIDNMGGVVIVTLEPGQPAYRGTTRHGVTSTNYGSYSLSYRLDQP